MDTDPLIKKPAIKVAYAALRIYGKDLQVGGPGRKTDCSGLN